LLPRIEENRDYSPSIWLPSAEIDRCQDFVPCVVGLLELRRHKYHKDTGRFQRGVQFLPPNVTRFDPGLIQETSVLHAQQFIEFHRRRLVRASMDQKEVP